MAAGADPVSTLDVSTLDVGSAGESDETSGRLLLKSGKSSSRGSSSRSRGRSKGSFFTFWPSYHRYDCDDDDEKCAGRAIAVDWLTCASVLVGLLLLRGLQ